MVDNSLVSNPSELKRVPIPEIKNNSSKIFSEESAYQMTSFLMGVIERGTAKNINNFKMPNIKDRRPLNSGMTRTWKILPLITMWQLLMCL